jgi:integrase/recombinase XerD
MLFLSKRKNGFYYVYYLNEFSKRASISTRSKRKNEALKFLADFKNQLEERKANKVIPISLEKFFFEYLKYSESIHTTKSTQTIRSAVNSYLKYFGAIQLSDLNKHNILEYLQHRSNAVSSYVVKRELAYLSAIFNWGITWRYMNENLTNGINKPKLPEKQPLFFSETDFQILLRAIDNQDINDLAVFSISTGLRQMELLTLRWSQIDFKQQALTLDNRTHITKSKKVRTIPLNVKAMQVLTQRLLNSNSDLVFTYNSAPIKQDFISKKFKKYILKAGLNPKLTFHALRASFGSWLVQKGCSIYNVMTLMGHSDVRITSKFYASLTTDNLMKSVNLLND